MNTHYTTFTNPFPFNYFDCSCNINDCSGTPVCCINCGRCQCTGSPCLFTPGMREITQKRIQKQVRVNESQYISNLSALTIQGGKKNLPFNLALNPGLKFFGVNQNQMSDRNQLHIQTRYVPGQNSNSTKSSITRLRPGSLGPAGNKAIGVDVKHNSYYRYLGRLKAKNLQASWSPDDSPYESPPLPLQNIQYSQSQLNYYNRFSKIKYGIIGSGLCNICEH